jgi:hypothetical protein
MRIQSSMLRGGVVLWILLTTVSCNQHRAFNVEDGKLQKQDLEIGVYLDPQKPTDCKVTYPLANVRRLADTVKWTSLDGNKYTVYFPAGVDGTPFDNDKYDDGVQTASPKVPAGKIYRYEIQLAGKKCKDAKDPYDDPGLSIKN